MVEGVTKDGFVYAAEDNADADQDSDGTSITVVRGG
jgi:hypothetical protein